MVHWQSSHLCFEDPKRFVLSTLPFVLCVFFVIINFHITLLNISCNDDILYVSAPHFVVACVPILGFSHYASGFDHVGSWVNVDFV